MARDRLTLYNSIITKALYSLQAARNTKLNIHKKRSDFLFEQMCCCIIQQFVFPLLAFISWFSLWGAKGEGFSNRREN